MKDKLFTSSLLILYDEATLISPTFIGGVYFLVSRSLGAELGASVGIIFAFANAVAASMNTIGFCDSLNELLKSRNMMIIDNGPNDTRIVGAIALLVMCVICAVGMDWETKTQVSLYTPCVSR